MTNQSEKKPRRSTRLEDVGRRIDDELEEFIAWINDELVPSIRNRSSKAVRKASEKLSEFADYMDQKQPPRS
ncbi:MAG: hypothetical protein ACE14M_04215 [Terriglobales bacterium]